MDYRPVLSGVYDLIKGKPIDRALPLWSEFIATRNEHDEHLVSLLKDPGNADLCEEEEEIIQQVYQAFGHLDPCCKYLAAKQIGNSKLSVAFFKGKGFLRSSLKLYQSWSSIALN